jgi:hypothetical protein
MGMEGLGRVFNVIPVAAGVGVSLKKAMGVTFVCTGNDTFTLQSMTAYNSGNVALPAITNYYTSTSTAGSAAWTDHTQAPASTVVIASGAASFYVDCGDLPAGADWVEVTVAASGLVMAIVHDLYYGEDPKNLPLLAGSTS